MQDYLNELGIVAWQQRHAKTTSSKTRITLVGDALTSAAQTLLGAMLDYLNIDRDTVDVVHESDSACTNASMTIALPHKTITTFHPADLLAQPLNKKKVLLDLV
jgi:hypothetical protein